MGEVGSSGCRCDLVRLLEFLLCVRFLTFVTKCQGQIVVRFGVAGLEAQGFLKRRLCFMDIPGLQQYETEIVVSLGKGWIAPHQIAKDIDCSSGIVVLAED